MQWKTAFVPRTGVPDLLKQGWHHVTINTFSRRMDEDGLRVSAAFQKYLVEGLGLAAKAKLIGLSWDYYEDWKRLTGCERAAGSRTYAGGKPILA